MGIAHGPDPRLVERLMLEAARDHPDVLDEPPPAVRLLSLGGPAMSMELLVWTQTMVHARRTLAVKGSAREVRALTHALNDASLTLREQYDALLKRDTELATLLETAADAVVGVDDQGRILMFNAAATSIFGLSAEQAQGRPLFALVPAALFAWCSGTRRAIPSWAPSSR